MTLTAPLSLLRASPQGEFANGLKHGDGLQVYSDCSTYQGQWRDGLSHGWGVHKKKNGDIYEVRLLSFGPPACSLPAAPPPRIVATCVL